MYPRMRIREIRDFNLDGGYLIDGFPSIGFSSAIATESMLHMSNFSLAGVISSDNFPPISLIKEGKPNFPTRIFVNDETKVSIFLSYLTLHESLHRTAAKLMLNWAKKKKIKWIVSSVAIKATNDLQEPIAVGSTDIARKKIKDAGFKVLENGVVPGIPGILLNEGNLNDQEVIVILVHSDGTGPDFRSSAILCEGISKLIPGTSCDLNLLQREAEKAEVMIKEAQEESKHLDTMYR